MAAIICLSVFHIYPSAAYVGSQGLSQTQFMTGPGGTLVQSQQSGQVSASSSSIIRVQQKITQSQRITTITSYTHPSPSLGGNYDLGFSNFHNPNTLTPSYRPNLTRSKCVFIICNSSPSYNQGARFAKYYVAFFFFVKITIYAHPSYIARPTHPIIRPPIAHRPPTTHRPQPPIAHKPPCSPVWGHYNNQCVTPGMPGTGHHRPLPIARPDTGIHAAAANVNNPSYSSATATANNDNNFTATANPTNTNTNNATVTDSGNSTVTANPTATVSDSGNSTNTNTVSPTVTTNPTANASTGAITIIINPAPGDQSTPRDQSTTGDQSTVTVIPATQQTASSSGTVPTPTASAT